jgi:hypothetical protein
MGSHNRHWQWLKRERKEGAFCVLKGCLCDYGKQVMVVWEREERYCDFA